MLNKCLIWILFFQVVSSLFAEKMEFSINYLSVSIANVVFYQNEKQINVHANSTKITQFLADTIDNSYIIKYEKEFLPISYQKRINQKKFKEESLTEFRHDYAIYHDLITNQKSNYQSIPNRRDFFSALYYLRKQNLHQNQVFNLDANKNPWICEVEFLKKEKLKTILGKKNTYKVKLNFKKNGQFKKGKSDILTNNLVSESNSLYFWFTDDELQIPVKAEYTSSPFSVTWLLTKYIE